MAAAGTGSGARPGTGAPPGAGVPPAAGVETLAAGRRSPGGLLSVLGALVSPRTWLAVIHLLAGLVVGLISFTVVVLGIGLGVGLMPRFLVCIPGPVAVTLLTGRGGRGRGVRGAVVGVSGRGGRAGGARFAVLLGVVIPAPPPVSAEPRGWRRMNLLFVARSTWLPTVYALLRLPVSAIEAVVVAAVW